MEQLAASPHDRVSSLVPKGFERYARIFHPAWRLDGHCDDLRVAYQQCGEQRTAISWAEMAASTGSHVHALMQWKKIAAPTLGGAKVVAPDEGIVPAAVSLPLVDLLSPHTGRDACWLGVWQGWGWAWDDYRLQVPQSTKSVATGEGPEGGMFRAPAQSGMFLAPARKWDVFRLLLQMGLQIVSTPFLKGVEHTSKTSVIDTWGGRTWDMFRAPLKMAFSPVFKRPSLDRTANLIWAADRSWWLTNDIDLDTSYIGGNARLIDSLLASDDLEVWPVRPEDKVSYDSDRLNSGPLHPYGQGEDEADLSTFLSKKKLPLFAMFFPNRRGKENV